jgi:ribosomal protein S18 acetylase RimI-like enzyme
MADEPTIEVLTSPQHGEIRPMLAALMLEEQRHYDHPQLSEAEVERDVARPPGARFTGENVILGARESSGRLVGMCWCVLFDPGTGLEAEVAEVFVDPAYRARGLGHRLLRRAIDLFIERGVTFASVWTRENNPQAVRLYEQAGFRRTEQLVLTWLPLPDRA